MGVSLTEETKRCVCVLYCLPSLLCYLATGSWPEYSRPGLGVAASLIIFSHVAQSQTFSEPDDLPTTADTNFEAGGQIDSAEALARSIRTATTATPDAQIPVDGSRDFSLPTAAVETVLQATGLHALTLRVSPSRHFDGPTSASADSDVTDLTDLPATRGVEDAEHHNPQSELDGGIDVEVPFTFPDIEVGTARASVVPSSAGLRTSFIVPSVEAIQLEHEYVALASERQVAPAVSDRPAQSYSSGSPRSAMDVPLRTADFDMPFSFDADTGLRVTRASAVPSSAGFRDSLIQSRPSSIELDDGYIALRRASADRLQQEYAALGMPLVALDSTDEEPSETPFSIGFSDVERALLPRSRSPVTPSSETNQLRLSAYEAEFGRSPRDSRRSMALSSASATPHSIAFTEFEESLDAIAPMPTERIQQSTPTKSEDAVSLPLQPKDDRLGQLGLHLPTSPGSQLTFGSLAAPSSFALSPSLGSGNEEDQPWPYSPTTSSFAHGVEPISEPTPPLPALVVDGDAALQLAASEDTSVTVVDVSEMQPAVVQVRRTLERLRYMTDVTLSGCRDSGYSFRRRNWSGNHPGSLRQ